MPTQDSVVQRNANPKLELYRLRLRLMNCRDGCLAFTYETEAEQLTANGLVQGYRHAIDMLDSVIHGWPCTEVNARQ